MTPRTGDPVSPLNRPSSACPPWCGTDPGELPKWEVVHGHVGSRLVFCTEACRDRAFPPAPEPEEETKALPTHCDGCGARFTMADLLNGHEHVRVVVQGEGEERLAMVERNAAAGLSYEPLLAGIRSTVQRAGAGHPWVLGLEALASRRLDEVRDQIASASWRDARRASWRRQLAAVAEVLGVVARARRGS